MGRTRTEADYLRIGRQVGSDTIADEADHAATRWQRDVQALARYGWGATRLAQFNTLREQHRQLRESRPEAIAAKTMAVEASSTLRQSAKAWEGRVTSLLEPLAIDDSAVDADLDAALDKAKGADALVGALLSTLSKYESRLPQDAALPECLEQGRELQAALVDAAGKKPLAFAGTIADTREIDVLDGRLSVQISGLNRAARRAIRAGALNATLTEYRRRDSARRKGEETSPPTGAPG